MVNVPSADSIPGILFNYNQQSYKVAVYLNNLNDGQSVTITPQAIIDLTIEESLAAWAVSGILSINFFDTILENQYVFRNDGYDTLTIRIYPCKEDGSDDDNFKNINWELNHFCSIYNIEDVPLPGGAASGAATAVSKCRKLYFRDFRYYELSTEILQYSTAFSLSALSNLPAAPDVLRSIPTGGIIKEILTAGITEKELNKITEKEEDWDMGASSLFYTAPADATAYESLMYAYRKHVSSITIPNDNEEDLDPEVSNSNDPANKTTNDFCILHIERGPDLGDYGQFVLRPLSKYFEQAGKDTPGKYQIEHFLIQDYNDKPGTMRSPSSPSGDINAPDRTVPDYNHIRDYEFVEIAPDINANVFVTRPIYSYNIGARQLNVDFHNNDVLTAKKFIGDKYIKQVFKRGDDSAQNFLINLTDTKKDLNLNPSFSLYGQDRTLRKVDGLVKLVQAGVFQNACIVFSITGSTGRIPGRFIAIDRIGGSPTDPSESGFDDKFCGQWFITDVSHKFNDNEYTNIITAVKLHRFQPPIESFKNTLDS